MGFLNLKAMSPGKGKSAAASNSAKRALGAADASEIRRHKDLRDEIRGGTGSRDVVKDMQKSHKQGER